MSDQTPGQQWHLLCKEWREKHAAVINFPLFERGWMHTDRLDQWNRLNAEEQDVRNRMDAFIAVHT
jgi:hypothetical protein